MRLTITKNRDRWDVITSGFKRTDDSRLFFSEKFDEDAIISGGEGRGPFLIMEGNRIRTDIFGQIPIFISKDKIDNRIFPNSTQHDPTKEIMINKEILLLKREKIIKVPVRDAVEELAMEFRKSVILRADHGTGVLLSGGVDSSSIATVLFEEALDFKAFCVAEGKDLEHAKAISKKMDIDMVEIHPDPDEVEEKIPEIYEIIGMKEYLRITPVYLPVITSLALTFYFALKEARNEGVKTVFSGIGSEELFAGFRITENIGIEEQIIQRTYTLYLRDLWRDYSIANNFGLSMKYPFLDRKFASIALSIPYNMKIRAGIKKYVWRKTAQVLGVPKDNAWRKNRSAQYGSGMDRILEKLAKRSGKRYKMKYLLDILG